jgi:hypothetical protein
MSQVLIKLLQCIHAYYPIGIPSLLGEYPGYKRLEEIVAKKINEVSDNIKTPWSALIEDIKMKFGKDNLLDQAFYQFPGYCATIELEKSKEVGKEFARSIVLNISLLTDHYTIFFEDSFKYSMYNDNKYGVSRPPTVKIIYCKSCLEKYYLDFIGSLKSLISLHLPKHEFIDHALLFDHEIAGGIPYGEAFDSVSNGNNSIYEYLFFNGINRRQMIILE